MNEPSRPRRAVADVGRFDPGAEIEVIWGSHGSHGRSSGRRVYVPVPDEQAIERAAKALEAEVKRRDEHYGLDNWDFREVVEFVAAALHPQLPKAQHGQEDTHAPIPPEAQ